MDTQLEAKTEADLINGITDSISAARKDVPNTYLSNPHSLIAQDTRIRSVAFGTGDSLYKSLLPHLCSAQYEILLVTCFWYDPCPTLASLSKTLIHLSSTRTSRYPELPPLRIRICLSSLSLWQKLFTPRKTYRPADIGLPPEHDLPGLDIKIKSLFWLPFSVMHPKFVVIDRKHVWMPSCNVSWEEWFEGAVLLSGSHIIQQFLKFYEEVWNTTPLPRLPEQEFDTEPPKLDTDGVLSGRSLDERRVQSIFLPSPHHINPIRRLAPKTPLNIYILSLFMHAKDRIFLQTPNLTSPPVLDGLKQALHRGVDVEILTSEKLMVLEQLVTALTTTSRCVRKLVKWYVAAQHEWDVEANGRLGALKISFYQRHKTGRGPVQSHLKLTIVDDRIAVLGSGNMDRASWFTSQELGVALISPEFVGECLGALDEAMEGRRKLVYDSRD